MYRPPSHVHLEIELQSDPIAGRFTGPRGEARSFRGWIELTEAIEDARVLGSHSDSDGGHAHASASRSIQ